VKQAGERSVGDKTDQQGIGRVSRSVSKEEARSDSGASSPTIKLTKKTTPSVQRSYFSKLVSIQKQPDPKPLIKRAPSDTDKGRREAATPKTPRRRKAKEGEADKKREVTPPYVKKKDPSKIREEAKSWLEGELTRIKCKEQSEPVVTESEGERPNAAREVAFNFTCLASTKSVEIATSHSNWEKMALVRQKSGASSEEEVWSISLSLTPGSHTFNYFVDGEWCTDPSLPTLSDSSGNVNNVVEVEENPLDFVPTSSSSSSSSPLSHLTASRARAPQRRPPSTRFLRKKTEGDLTPPEEEVEAVVGKIEISLSSVTDMSHSGEVPPAASVKTADPRDGVNAAQALLPPDHNAGGGKAGVAAGPAETEEVSLSKGEEKEVLPPPALETTAEKQGEVASDSSGKGEDKHEVKTGGGSKAEASCSDAGMGNGKSAAKGGTFPLDVGSDISHTGSPAESELINTVNENIKKICIDPRYQADSRTQLLIKEVLSQVVNARSPLDLSEQMEASNLKMFLRPLSDAEILALYHPPQPPDEPVVNPEERANEVSEAAERNQDPTINATKFLAGHPPKDSEEVSGAGKDKVDNSMEVADDKIEADRESQTKQVDIELAPADKTEEAIAPAEKTQHEKEEITNQPEDDC